MPHHRVTTNLNTMLAVAVAAATGSVAAYATQQKPAAPVVEVYKSASCGCCSMWIEHLRTSGFDVRTNNVEDIDAVKGAYRVPKQLSSCHTATVGGYVVEGHVPAWDVRRVLKERPAFVGIAVPGMPAGSPGMETPGAKPQPFNVMSFDKAGSTQVFARY